MPAYSHLEKAKLDLEKTSVKMSAMRTLGVPYTADEVQSAAQDARAQGEVIAADLAAQQVKIEPDSELVAVISYLQRLGKKPEAAKPGGAVAATSGGEP